MHKLTRYLEKMERSQAWFAEKIGTTPTHLGRLIKGQSMPGLLLAYEIEKKTKGMVTLYDWIPEKIKTKEEKYIPSQEE